jgi:basic membrane lipoprotein Med (substrate-binding protein (PBP1-ABC) superfamily)/DNA-binding SARP family transcriptional activator
VEFRILGDLEVRDDGATVDLGPPKARAVLAALLVRRDCVVPTDRLIDDVWGEEAPRTAGHSVQTYVSGLRKALGGERSPVMTRSGGYLLHVEPDLIDSDRFEHLAAEGASRLAAGEPQQAIESLERALEIWRGSPLPDFAYAEFAQAEIRRLEELHVTAVDDLAESYLLSGRADHALGLAKGAVAERPLHERSRGLLMRALAGSGRRAEALQAYSSYRHRLADELGIEPSAELSHLEQRILSQDPEICRKPLERARSARRSPVVNPYLGLRPFTESDAASFFGRNGLTRRIGEAVRERSMIAVVGPSGSGKSSVVGAGLVPEVRRWPDWVVATMIPSRHPFVEVEAALARIGAVGDLEPVLGSKPHGLLRGVLRALPSDAGTLLLVVDQFEELFTLTEPDERERFLSSLSVAAADSRRRLRVLAAVRSDFYDALLRTALVGDIAGFEVVNVLPMAAADIETAAVAPAASAGVTVEPELVAELVADTIGRPGALPLFQDVLTSLFERRADEAMTLADYESIGRLGGALQRRSERVYGSLENQEASIARQVFLHLVVPQAEGRPTRRRAPLAELAAIAPDGGAVAAVVDRFVESRLLTLDRDAVTGEPTVEIAHESLIAAWDRLASWVDLAEEDVRNHHALLSAARMWRLAGSDPDYLWKGERLARYEAWSAESGFALAGPERAFLDASADARDAADATERSRREREQRLERRARFRIWSLAAVVVVLAAVGTFAVLTYLALPQAPEVVLVYEGAGDSGWNDQLLGGVDRAASDLDIEVRKHATAGFSLGAELRAISEEGPSLVLVPSGLWQAEIEAMASEYPEILYAVFDTVGDVPAMSYTVFDQHHGSFLVGAAAAMKTQTGVVGFVGGVNQPFMWGFENGFAAGVAAVDPDIEVLSAWLTDCWDFSGFLSPRLGYDAAAEMYAGGADVVFAAAGASGRGVFQAAVDASGETGIHRWAIGVDTDEYRSTTALEFPPGGLDPPAWKSHILTSMLKRVDRALYDAMAAWDAGTYGPGLHSVGLEGRYIDYSTSGGYIDDIVADLERFRERIIAGEIDVPYWLEGQSPGDSPCFADTPAGA